MKTIKAIAAVVLAMFVGSANADIKLTQKRIEHFASLAEYEEPFTVEDIQCTLIAEMQVRGVMWALEEAKEGRDVRKNIRRLGLRAAVDFPDQDMETDFMQRRDVLKAVYKGAYVGIAYGTARETEEGKSVNRFDSPEAQQKLYDAAFNVCLKEKDNNPEGFYHYYAIGRLAEGYQNYPYIR